LRQVRIITGAVLHPLGGYLLHRGLATLPLRVEAATRSAAVLASRLAEHDAVEFVRYPSASVQMRGTGAMIAFGVHGDPTAIVRRLKLTTPAVSLGSVDTLIEHPWALTHRLVPDVELRASGVPENLLRISVGLEHVEDIWDDLNLALKETSCDVSYVKPSPGDYLVMTAAH
jgi:methionine-gamma-lyase